jgi:hypothetical protein
MPGTAETPDIAPRVVRALGERTAVENGGVAEHLARR